MRSNYDNNNNEIIIKHEPLVYTRVRRAVKKKEEEEEEKNRLGQYNSSNQQYRDSDQVRSNIGALVPVGTEQFPHVARAHPTSSSNFERCES